MNAPKKQFTAQQTTLLIPIIKKFNGLAKGLIGVLSKRISEKEKRIQSIKVLLTDVKIPKSTNLIDIRAIDVNKTSYKKRGSSSYNKVMDWEKEMRKGNRGIIL